GRGDVAAAGRAPGAGDLGPRPRLRRDVVRRAGRCGPDPLRRCDRSADRDIVPREGAEMTIQSIGRRWRPLLVVAAAAAAIAAVAGSATAGTERGTAAPVLRVGVTTDIASIDPDKVGACCGFIAQFFDLTYGGLFHYSPSGKTTPELATSGH